MSIWESLLLGAVQGLTEFLPVSSSGHLVIFQHFLGITQNSLTFDIFVHLGTLVAVFIAFRKDILYILRHPFNKLTYLIVVGCIPAGLAGFFLKPYFEQAFESILVVGLGLLFTGFILMVSEYLSKRDFGLKTETETSYKDVIFIGIIQAIAIIPGISRSGSTIAGGLLAGLDREFAARYSFLLSIPVILGAAVAELKSVLVEGIDQAMIIPYIAGPLMAAVFGLLAIKLVMGLVKKGRLSVFSYYCWTVALFLFVNYFFFH